MSKSQNESETSTLKIIQILASPDNSAYQSALLGLGSDGNIYRAEKDCLVMYFPNMFAKDNQ